MELNAELEEVITAIEESGCWLGGPDSPLLLALLDASDAFPSCPVQDDMRQYFM